MKMNHRLFWSLIISDSITFSQDWAVKIPGPQATELLPLNDLNQGALGGQVLEFT